MFDLDHFIDELRGALTAPSRRGVADIVARAIADPAALLGRIGVPDRAGIRVLHRAPDLTLLDVVWAPNQVAPPHDHRLSAVIGLYGGREDNVFWRRLPERDAPQIEIAGGRSLGAGDTMILGPDIVHSVVNPLARLSGAIHVYDGDLLGVARSMWNAETLTEQPHDYGAAAPTPFADNRHVAAQSHRIAPPG